MNQNQVLLIGYVGTDLHTQPLPSGNQRVALRVATHYQTSPKEGGKKHHTVWHDVVAWDHTAEYAGRNFVKGSRILVEGCIEYRCFPDKSGHMRYYTRIKAKSLLNLDR